MLHTLMRMAALAFCLVLGIASACFAEFSFNDDGTSLTVLENGKPVLSYNHGRMNPPQGIDAERYWRSCYIHPLYGLDGDVLTGDFQRDHPHHRGIFWAWPRCRIGDQKVDEWHFGGIRQFFEKWLAREAGPDTAEVGVQNVWLLDNGTKPKVREQIRFTIHRADESGREIDFRLKFTNVAEVPVTIKGQNEAGYGGFAIRMDGARPEPVITTARGWLKEDTNRIDTPWADFSSRARPDGPISGVAIFQHPANPGYPHSGWTLRYYGFLGAAWPHDEPFVLPPRSSFELRYRIYVHCGTAEDAGVTTRFAAYTAR